MNILIVNDHLGLAETLAELLTQTDRLSAEPRITNIRVAGDLEAARRSMDWFDAVLCDAHFPVDAGGKPCENWAIVCLWAQERSKRYLIHSADPDIVDFCKNVGFPAFAKPSSIEDIYAGLVPSRRRDISELAGIDMLPAA